LYQPISGEGVQLLYPDQAPLLYPIERIALRRLARPPATLENGDFSGLRSTSGSHSSGRQVTTTTYKYYIEKYEDRIDICNVQIRLDSFIYEINKSTLTEVTELLTG